MILPHQGNFLNSTRLFVKDFEFDEMQKNWSPFIHNKILYLEYSIEPHVILQVNIYSGECTIMYITFSTQLMHLSHNIGTLRGGPPSLFIEERNIYLGVSHCRYENGNIGSVVYYHILYIFSGTPPFQITSFSSPFIFPTKLSDYSKFWFIQFASGLIRLSDNETLLLSYGENDCDSKLIHISIDKALTIASTFVSWPINSFLEVEENIIEVTPNHQKIVYNIEIQREWSRQKIIRIAQCKSFCSSKNDCIGFRAIFTLTNIECEFRTLVSFQPQNDNYLKNSKFITFFKI
eukprot:c9188_g1_i1.p1 GENE.c9188_g1_i1~~c9188_g1_i1.p1  ORF type:complete len:291 (-),score=57.43 c9188_g1_i1:33-905(-)